MIDEFRLEKYMKLENRYFVIVTNTYTFGNFTVYGEGEKQGYLNGYLLLSFEVEERENTLPENFNLRYGYVFLKKEHRI